MATVGAILSDDSVFNKLHLDTFIEFIIELSCSISVINIDQGGFVPLRKKGMWILLKGDLKVERDNPTKDLEFYKKYLLSQQVALAQSNIVLGSSNGSKSPSKLLERKS
jgi:hypothetical protein